MARADSSPKAIVKAAIRTKCHVVARRYEHQRLEKLHGSNVKWLVLSDELFDEVCNDFTIRKLGMDRDQKRALFDAEWVSQVTYELITKPARPRRMRQGSGDESISPVSPSSSIPERSEEGTGAIATSPMLDPFATQPPSFREYSPVYRRRSTAGSARRDSFVGIDPCLLPGAGPKMEPNDLRGDIPGRPRWFETVLN